MENLHKAVFRKEVIPFYFGVSPKRLYGCHHLPQGKNTREFNVVLCSPIGQEYTWSHRTSYQLAVQLSRAGFHVLRFDYFGCGDSEGDFEQGGWIQWTKDIHTAIEEMQRRIGIKSICLIGLRIGATLALEAAGNCHHIMSMILWEPVFNGRLYLKELDKRQRKFYTSLHLPLNRKKRRMAQSRTAKEILGFRMNLELIQELERIKIDHTKLPSEVKLLGVFNREKSNSSDHLSPFAKELPNAQFNLIKDHIWWEQDRLIPFETIRYIANWVERVH